MHHFFSPFVTLLTQLVLFSAVLLSGETTTFYLYAFCTRPVDCLHFNYANSQNETRETNKRKNYPYIFHPFGGKNSNGNALHLASIHPFSHFLCGTLESHLKATLSWIFLLFYCWVACSPAVFVVVWLCAFWDLICCFHQEKQIRAQRANIFTRFSVLSLTLVFCYCCFCRCRFG